jgi:fumarate reductase subunit C
MEINPNPKVMEKKILPNIKMYRRPINIFWWANRWIHIKFIARELTSICVALYSLEFFLFVWSVLSGPEQFEAFTSFMQSPTVLVVNILILGGLVFHSITWFNLAPKAMVVKLGKSPIPGWVIALMNYIGWIVISVFLVWLISGF